MLIYNSSDYLATYLAEHDFSDIYTENSSLVPLQSTVDLPSSGALDFLFSSAMVGNKVLGIFERLPQLPPLKALRGTCVLISTTLPATLDIPIFFCRCPEDIIKWFPKAIKLAGEGPYPVHIVLSHNVLNNYLYEGMNSNGTDRGSPYIAASLFTGGFSQKNADEKLKALTENWPASPLLTDVVAFELQEASFPEYVLPGRAPRLGKVFTTEKSSGFVSMIADECELMTELSEDAEKTKIYLCPGCPVGVIFSRLDLKNIMVFSSLTCPAIYKVLPIYKEELFSYQGLISHGLNMPTLFIAPSWQLRGLDSTTIKKGNFIALKDDNEKAVLPEIGALKKLKQLKSLTFPYGCRNIKKYSKIKVKSNKCVCTTKSTPDCIEKSRCPALYHVGVVQLDTELCTGCGVCAKYCSVGCII